MKKLIVALTLTALALGPALQAADAPAAAQDKAPACCAGKAKTSSPASGCCPAMSTKTDKASCPMMTGCPVKQDVTKKSTKASTKKSKALAKGSKDASKQSKDLATK